jgi:quercetin dioxygenase-like cupin family protein
VVTYVREIPPEIQKGAAKVADIISAAESPRQSMATVRVTKPYPPHRFKTMTQSVHVLRGAGWAIVDGERYELVRSASLQVEPGEVHEYHVRPGGYMLLLVTNTPAYTLEDVVWVGSAVGESEN